jgi:hypothetical protein
MRKNYFQFFKSRELDRGMALTHRLFALLCMIVSVMPARSVWSQAVSTASGRDSVVVVAGKGFAAGGLRRFLLGDDYRDLWTTPIKVPVLDLRAFRGGLRPVEQGGGKQTATLRFIAADNTEYVFRPVHKTPNLSDQFKGTIIWNIFSDQGSASHPAGPVGAAPLLGRVGVLHPEPVLYAMPDDPVLGEFRKHYAGMLGAIEEYPSPPKNAPGFAGAIEIIDSEELFERINKDPVNRVDARALLTARLMDLLIGDNDRHPGQWRWARLASGSDPPWVPIPRDRDKAFLSYEGLLLKLARRAEPSLVTFDSTYPTNPAVYFGAAIEFDRRLLANLDKSAWDSVANSLVRSITDSVIDEAVRVMPREYAPSSRMIAEKLKSRRDQLPDAAARYYLTLWKVADVHGSDADDRATVVRSGDGSLDLTIQSGTRAPWFHRRFDPAETREIRLYLHGGNDMAVVTGDATRSIKLRIIGGNGNNTLVDSSRVAGRTNPTRLYESGVVDGVKYETDTARKDTTAEIDESLMVFNRLPLSRAYGTLIPPVRDRGSSVRPVIGLRSSRGLGTAVRIGAARYVYGFRRVPYKTMTKAEVAYATSNRYEVGLAYDYRLESSGLHIPAEAKMSQFEVFQFHGFGNDVPDLHGLFYDVRQRQWTFRPAVGFSFWPQSDISLGPIVRFTSTDSLPNRFIAEQRPYGFPDFGQVGLQLRLHFDSRVEPDTTKPRGVLDLTGSTYPAMWDVENAYSAVSGVASAFITLPVPKRPVLALRAGGKKLFGDFPYFDAAFLGGASSLRVEHRQQFAGDASVFGTAELRVPVAQFPLILPLDVGLIGFADAGRVYVDSESPGGWHTAVGGGFWVGFLDPGKSVNVVFTNREDRRVLVSLGFAF